MGASQEDLYREARGLLRRLGLMEMAREVGRAWLVGSVPLKLIVKPDIDVHVLVGEGPRHRGLRQAQGKRARSLFPERPSGCFAEKVPGTFSLSKGGIEAPEVDAALAIARQLMERRGVRKLEMLRFLFRDAVKVGFDQRVGGRTWHVDVWVTADPDHLGVGPTRWVRRRLTPGLRRAIMRLKRHYAARDMCRYGMSAELYRAVIEAGVRTPRQFLEYARTHELSYRDALDLLEADARGVTSSFGT